MTAMPIILCKFYDALYNAIIRGSLSINICNWNTDFITYFMMLGWLIVKEFMLSIQPQQSHHINYIVICAVCTIELHQNSYIFYGEVFVQSVLSVRPCATLTPLPEPKVKYSVFLFFYSCFSHDRAVYILNFFFACVTESETPFQCCQTSWSDVFL